MIWLLNILVFVLAFTIGYEFYRFRFFYRGFKASSVSVILGGYMTELKDCAVYYIDDRTAMLVTPDGNKYYVDRSNILIQVWEGSELDAENQ